MNIKIKTGGLLGKYLPAGGNRNRAELEVPEGATPRDVIKLLNMPPTGTYLVIVNGDAVPPSEQASLSLVENDTLAIMPPLKGG